MTRPVFDPVSLASDRFGGGRRGSIVRNHCAAADNSLALFGTSLSSNGLSCLISSSSDHTDVILIGSILAECELSVRQEGKADIVQLLGASSVYTRTQ